MHKDVHVCTCEYGWHGLRRWHSGWRWHANKCSNLPANHAGSKMFQNLSLQIFFKEDIQNLCLASSVCVFHDTHPMAFLRRKLWWHQFHYKQNVGKLILCIFEFKDELWDSTLQIIKKNLKHGRKYQRGWGYNKINLRHTWNSCLLKQCINTVC